MKRKAAAHLKMFLKDHLWILLLYTAAPVGLILLGNALSGKSAAGMAYYLFLSGFIAIVYLGYRLYVTWEMYEIFCNGGADITDYLLKKPRCSLESHYQKAMLEVNGLHLSQLAMLENRRNENKTLIYRWVHQVKTPLSVIRLVTEERSADPNFRKIANASGQIQYDLNQILNLYKLDSVESDFHTERVSLAELTRDCINSMRSLFIGRNVYPKLSIDGSIQVITDYKWMKFVLYQLLTNAVKYSDDGAKVSISAKRCENGVALEVRDSGCGIEQCDIDRIFDLFFTGQNGRMRGESSGLGLYMVKKVLDYLGHSISVESTVNEGTAFHILMGAPQDEVHVR